MSAPSTPSEPGYGSHQGALRIWDVISLLVGIVIGVSIFQVPASVFIFSGRPEIALFIWFLAALLAFCGALCYAELASAFPAFGAEYTYLAHAFGRGCAFLFAWMTVCAVLPGNMGAAAFVFATYAGQIHPLLAAHPAAVAATAILVLTLLQLIGLVAGRFVQNLLTVVKLVSLSVVLLCGFMLPAFSGEPVAQPASPPPLDWQGIGLALVFVLYAYGGWNDVATVTPEVRDCRKNMPRALLFGLIIVAVTYLLMNFVFLRVLGWEEAKTIRAPAAVIVERALGPAFSSMISFTIMASALGAMNGMLFSGCRLLTAVGEDYALFRAWSSWNSRRVPVWSLLTICSISLLMTGVLGTDTGRLIITEVITTMRQTPPNWEEIGGGFEVLLAAAAPVFWTFFLLTGVALIVLRIRQPDLLRPFRVPLYPVPVIVFIITAGYMLWSSLLYAKQIVVLLVPVLAMGIVLSAFQKVRRIENPPPSETLP